MEISRESANLMRKHNIALDESLFVRDQYDRENALKCEEDVLVEAKRIILNKQFEKIANITLNDEYNTTSKPCRQAISWDNTIWNAPAPESSLNILRSELKTKSKKHVLQTLEYVSLKNKIQEIKLKHMELKKDQILAEKYVKKWKEKVKNKKVLQNKEQTSENKMDTFIKSLKKLKKEQRFQIKKKENQEKNKLELKSQKKINEKTIGTSDDNNTFNAKGKPGCYENRYKAQKHIILLQKYKLLEQERQIEELKYGKLTDELSKSLQQTEKELREMYNICSVQTKCKLGLPNKTPIELIELQSQQAPKIVREMEKRALERAQKRQIIQERRKFLEEERKRIALELIEKKHQQDEDEKRQNLEAIKLRRMKELEAERKRKTEKEWLIINLEKADRFYKKRLKKKFIKRLKVMMRTKEENEYKANIFYEATIEKCAFVKWRSVVSDVWKEKERIADNLYRKCIMKKCLQVFIANYKITKEDYQVAEDYFNYRLQWCVFNAYFIYVRKMKKKRYILLAKAANHYNNRILIQYFYQWRSLKAVLQLEKAKEEKKRKWREKVLEVLPDYKPPIEEE